MLPVLLACGLASLPLLGGAGLACAAPARPGDAAGRVPGGGAVDGPGADARVDGPPSKGPSGLGPGPGSRDAPGRQERDTELRGVWLTRFDLAEGGAPELRRTLSRIAGAGFNTVFFQVRGTFDAWYDSRLEPWAAALSGTLGADPGWDPLRVAVDAAHAEGLRLHAYLNVAPLWRGTEPPASVGIPHPMTLHPRWRVADRAGRPMALNEGYVFASLGNPEVRAWTAAVAADVERRYDVDGIHLDYIRYPGPGWSHDAVSEARFVQDTAAGGPYAGLGWHDWQRAMVEDTVRQVRDAVSVPVSAAVWGVYTDAWGWGRVTEGLSDYDQDSRALQARGLTDAVVPMIYWPVAEVEGDRLDFRVLLRDHLAHAAGRHVYAGIGTFDIGYEDTLRCIDAAREAGAQGVVLFSWRSVAEHVAQLRAGPFARPADPPAMTWR